MLGALSWGFPMVGTYSPASDQAPSVFTTDWARCPPPCGEVSIVVSTAGEYPGS